MIGKADNIGIHVPESKHSTKVDHQVGLKKIE